MGTNDSIALTQQFASDWLNVDQSKRYEFDKRKSI